jgi:hypothetical protein
MPARLWTTLVLLAFSASTAACTRAPTTPVSSQDYSLYGSEPLPGDGSLAHSPFLLAGPGAAGPSSDAPLSSTSTGSPPELIGYPAPQSTPPELRPSPELRPGVPAPARLNTANIPGGDRCLELLRNLGVRHQVIDAKKGVVTPVELNGAIGGVEFSSPAGPMVADCRLIVALAWVAPELRALGVARVIFSGAYSYRMSRVGRLSLHAYGLAIDVHEIVARGTTSSVERDFSRGLADGCNEASPVLNQVACRLKRLGAFKELLTPDYDADHANHLHLAVAPLTTTSSGPSPTLPDELLPRKRTSACESRTAQASSGHSERRCGSKPRATGLNRKVGRAR